MVNELSTVGRPIIVFTPNAATENGQLYTEAKMAAKELGVIGLRAAGQFRGHLRRWKQIRSSAVD
jgi:hypothetical protein